VIITIMWDWGCYAWVKDEDDGTTLVGGGIELGDLEHLGLWVSPGLEQQFNDWAGSLPDHCADPDSDWWAFHERGIELCRRLKAQVGDQVRVVYDKSGEDPASVLTERIEILADGTLKRITVRLS
jgi:hypothetical protein